MITVQWWVLPILVFAGVGLAGFCATVWRAHMDAVGQLLAPVAEREPDPVPQPRQAPVPPWADPLMPPSWPEVDTSWRPFGARVDGSEFAGEDTVTFRAIGFPLPVAKPKPVDDEPQADPRERFAAEPRLPEPPVVKTLTVTLPDPLAPRLPGEVITSEIEVPA